MGFTLNVGALSAALKTEKDLGLQQTQRIMEETMREAEGLQRQILDAATTNWGETRYGRGRGASAGRRDTDAMYQAISSRVTADATRIEGRWGWLDQIERYFGIQDWGGGGVPPAHSLLDSFTQIRERWIARMREMVK